MKTPKVSTAWYTVLITCIYEGRLISSRNCFITEIWNRKWKNKIHHNIRLLKADIELKFHLDILKNKVYMINWTTVLCRTCSTPTSHWRNFNVNVNCPIHFLHVITTCGHPLLCLCTHDLWSNFTVNQSWLSEKNAHKLLRNYKVFSNPWFLFVSSGNRRNSKRGGVLYPDYIAGYDRRLNPRRTISSSVSYARSAEAVWICFNVFYSWINHIFMYLCIYTWMLFIMASICSTTLR